MIQYNIICKTLEKRRQHNIYIEYTHTVHISIYTGKINDIHIIQCLQLIKGQVGR